MHFLILGRHYIGIWSRVEFIIYKLCRNTIFNYISTVLVHESRELSKCVIELEFQLLLLDSDAVLNLRLEFCCTGSPVELSHEQWRSWLKKNHPAEGGPLASKVRPSEMEPRKWHFLWFRGWKDVTKQSFNTSLTGVFSLRKIQKSHLAQRSSVLGLCELREVLC